MSSFSRRLRDACGLSLMLGLAVLAACESEANNPCPNLNVAANDSANTEFVVVRRPWNAGEREALIASIKSSGGLSLPYVGDISANADMLFDVQCASDIVSRASLQAASASPIDQTSPFGPTYSLDALRVPGVGWTSSGVDVHIVNNQQSGDTFDWLVLFWVNTTEPTWKGFIIGATANTTFPATAVNTTNFDNNNAKIGSGGGEARAATSTVWNANGSGAPNTFQVISSSVTGGSSTITTGPFLGGTSAPFQMNQNTNNVGMTRVLGGGAPLNQTASLAGTVTGTSYNCIFPTPCTTNVPNLAVAALHRELTSAEYAQLPWVAAMPENARQAALRAHALRLAALQK